MLGASPSQIEQAIGIVVSQYVPWRSSKYGWEYNDLRKVGAGLSTENAIQSVHRVMDGLKGPKDIFRNPN